MGRLRAQPPKQTSSLRLLSGNNSHHSSSPLTHSPHMHIHACRWRLAFPHTLPSNLFRHLFSLSSPSDGLGCRRWGLPDLMDLSLAQGSYPSSVPSQLPMPYLLPPPASLLPLNLSPLPLTTSPFATPIPSPPSFLPPRNSRTLLSPITGASPSPSTPVPSLTPLPPLPLQPPLPNASSSYPSPLPHFIPGTSRYSTNTSLTSCPSPTTSTTIPPSI